MIDVDRMKKCLYNTGREGCPARMNAAGINERSRQGYIQEMEDEQWG
jgi:hypothetical protein